MASLDDMTRTEMELLKRFRLAVGEGGDGRVNLEWMGLRVEHAPCIAAQMEEAAEDLKALNLAHNLLGDVGARLVAESMRHCPCLEALDLEDNTIGARGVNYVARAMRTCPSLRSLNIKRNQAIRRPPPIETSTPPPTRIGRQVSEPLSERLSTMSLSSLGISTRFSMMSMRLRVSALRG